MSVYLRMGTIPVRMAGTEITSAAPTWIRPPDWLVMPNTGSEEFIGLFAVYTGSSNFVALIASGSYWVDWGDGVSSSYSASQTAEYSHNYGTLPSSSWSSGSISGSGMGYRQSLVRVTPSGSAKL